ncbi:MULTISPECIES: hypothetical protein [Burkholderia]|uniref:Fis family transcriptional regulator n=1 Tax=Burkholderia paludis TaxID=1506587 RepID=A0A6P2R637_9BURK|nr:MULTISPECIES: hypothetical protein [Burkholderia]CAB3771580.1 hypothetical protein LMG30113_06502 [Burkholderia paludis]VWC28228.1 Fis family transcriptional regulator [Burkholderia paludis]
MTRSSRIKRKPLTKAQLLPLSNANVRTLSLEAHVALAAVRSGQGGAIQVGHLARTVYVTFFLLDSTAEGMDVELFQRAESVVDQCIERASSLGKWFVPEEDLALFERLLKLYDAQLEAVPAYRFSEAIGQFQRAMIDSLRRPFDSAERARLEFTISELRAQMK